MNARSPTPPRTAPARARAVSPRAPADHLANLWQPLGPITVLRGPATGAPRVTGRINAIAVHEAGDRVYAATANGGVWFSPDGGGSWESLGGLDATDGTGVDRSAHRNACGAIAVSFGTGGSPDVIYVGTGEVTHPYRTRPETFMSAQTGRPFAGVGILRGERPAAGGAVTWVREARNLIGNSVYRIALEPGGTGVVAATLKGLFERPAAAGADVDWTRPTGAPFDTLDVECTDLLWTEAQAPRPARLWVWVQSGDNAGLWFRAGNAGAFSRVETPGTRGRRAVLAASTPPDQVWALVDQPDDVTEGATAVGALRTTSAAPFTARAGHVAEQDCGEHVSGTPGEGFYELTSGTISPVTYRVVDGVAMFEGDIRLGPVAEVEAFSASVRTRLAATGSLQAEPRAVDPRGSVITGNQFRWPGGIVPFVTQPSIRDIVLNAIRHWEQHTRIRFVERVPANAAFYPNWVDYQRNTGCSSSIGMRGGGAQIISLGPDCGVGQAIHETGHSLGLFHEQTRNDRNTYVTVQVANIIPANLGDFSQQPATHTDIGQYDYGSIMHYGRDFFSSNGQDTLVPLGGQAIGQRESLSPGDIATIRAIYPALQRPLLFRVNAAGAATPVAQVVIGVPDCLQQLGYDSLALAVDPTAANQVLLGGHDFATTTPDNAPITGDAAILVATVTAVNGYLQYGGALNTFTMLGIGVPAGVHDLKYSNAGTRLWAACDGGLFRSDRPASPVGFAPRHQGIDASEVVALGEHPKCEGHLVASFRGDALVERVTTGAWRLLDHAGARGIAFDPLDPRRFVVQRGPGRYASSDGSLTGDEVVSRAGTVARAEQRASAPYSVPALIANHRGATNLSQLLAGTNRLWYSENFGTSWVTLPTATDPLPANTDQDGFEEPITACAWQSPDVAWVLGESRVVRYARTPGSDAGGGPGAWTKEVILRRTVKPKKDTTSADRAVRRAEVWNDIAVNLDAPPAEGQPPASHGPKGALYLGTSGLAGDATVDTLWWFDGNSQWYPTNLPSLGTAAPVTALACDPAFPNEVYVGTTLGIWKGERSQPASGAPVWAFTPLVNGLPESPVQSLAFFTDGVVRLLRAGIAARGTWELRLDTEDVPTMTYLRVHDDDLRHRTTASLVGRDGSTLRSWHGSPDIRVRPAPAAPAVPATLPWTRTSLNRNTETLRRFQAALRARTGDPRVRPTGDWDKYFDEVIRDLGAPMLPGATPNIPCIDAAFWALSMVAPHVTAEPWGAGTPTEADLLEYAPELAEGDASRASCEVSGVASRVDVVVHRRGAAPVDGGDVRVALLSWVDPRDAGAATWSDATTWPFNNPVPWTAAVSEALNSATGDTMFSFGDGWSFVGTTPATRRLTLAGQTLTVSQSGVVTFDLNLLPIRRDRLVLLVAVVRTLEDIELVPMTLQDLVLSHANIAVRSLRVT